MKLLGLKPKMPKPTPVQRPAMRDEIRDQLQNEDELRRRRGGAADIVTGSMGAEAPSGGKAMLGS